MKRTLPALAILLLASCGPVVREYPPAVSLTLDPVPNSTSAPEPSNVEILANLPQPDCSKGLTPENQEGPYYKPDSPEQNVLFEGGMQGKKLIVAGFVMNKDCLPIPNAWLDFWQADANGVYDNEGYTLRGHQFTDNKGRYYLETVFPGLYPERPIGHIHVKAGSPGGEILTTQLYFPAQPVDGLTVTLEDKGDYFIAYFHFILE
ncbi:MAG: intradiol ring-cleavage dioxygenase [Chloroflexi bacterium]|nr:intradiol ring-cleavage dioxygenase [Chloroflexota bacterium]